MQRSPTTGKARTVSTMLHPQLKALAWLTVAVLAVAFATPAAAEPGDGTWDPTLPKSVSAGAPGDPLAIANASLRATALATQTTMDLGRNFLRSLGLGASSPVPFRSVRAACLGARLSST